MTDDLRPGRAWAVVEEGLQIRSITDDDSMDDIFVVIDHERLQWWLGRERELEAT